MPEIEPIIDVTAGGTPVHLRPLEGWVHWAVGRDVGKVSARAGPLRTHVKSPGCRKHATLHQRKVLAMLVLPLLVRVRTARFRRWCLEHRGKSRILLASSTASRHLLEVRPDCRDWWTGRVVKRVVHRVALSKTRTLTLPLQPPGLARLVVLAGLHTVSTGQVRVQCPPTPRQRGARCMSRKSPSA